MHTLAVRRSFVLVAIGALTATGLSLGPVAAEPRSPVPVSEPSPEDRPTLAAGVIVKTTTSTASTGLVRAAEDALPSGVGLDRVRKSAAGGRTSVLPTTERVTADEAEAVAAELRERSDVVWAAPNYILRAHAAPPVPVTDPYFVGNNARAVWDWRARTDAKVVSVMGSSNTFPRGGFSSRAPYAWQATRGEGAVVAVIDTGITTHSDLPTWDGATAGGRMLPGRDFVSEFTFEDGFVEDTGRDGDGWDPNPQDQGDWEPSNYCYEDSPSASSSWHGTHVAGIVAGARDNGGMVGVAPEAKILPVRALGLCGGTTEDIGAAMRWSAGLPVTDPRTLEAVPVNANPADVINMSLGVYVPCSSLDAQPMVEAIAAVRATGAVVVASAGNEGVSMSTNPVVPASCAGVLAVGSTSEYGDRAGYVNSSRRKSVYSNYGSAVDLMAPGGDVYWSSAGGIVSSVNSGKTTPAAQTYARYSGTSMAAPVVSAAAALLKSANGELTAAQTEAAVKASVQAFPRGASTQYKPCSTSICGTGIIDLAKIQVPRSATTIGGTPTIGEPLTAARGSWVRIPTSFSYQWLRDGEPIPGATGATYYPTRDDVGKKLSARMSPGTAAYAAFGSTSAATAPVPDGPEVTMTGLLPTVTYGVGATATVTVKNGETPVDGVVELRRGSTVLGSATTTDGTATITIAGTQWVAGTNVVRAVFVGSDSAASSAGTPVAVGKAVTSAVTRSVPSRVRYTSRATLVVGVRVPNVPRPTGELRVYDGTRRIATATLFWSNAGTRSILLPRLSKGYHLIKVKYMGNSVITAKTSTARGVTSY